MITDPVQVIGLYPNLLPSSYQNRLSYPSPPPIIEGLELEDALNALIELLTDVIITIVLTSALGYSIDLLESS